MSEIDRLLQWKEDIDRRMADMTTSIKDNASDIEDLKSSQSRLDTGIQLILQKLDQKEKNQASGFNWWGAILGGISLLIAISNFFPRGA